MLLTRPCHHCSSRVSGSHKDCFEIDIYDHFVIQLLFLLKFHITAFLFLLLTYYYFCYSFLLSFLLEFLRQRQQDYL